MSERETHSEHRPHDPEFVKEEGVTSTERETLVPDLLARRFAGDSRSYWKIVWDDFRSRRSAVVALCLIIAMTSIAVLAPLIANHRPILLSVPATALEGDREYVGVTSGLQSPMLGALSIQDWLLLFSSFIFVVAFFVRRRAARQSAPVGDVGLIALGVAGLLPLIIAMIVLFVRVNEGRFTDMPGTFGESRLRVLAFGVVGMIGLAMFIVGMQSLVSRARDALGNLKTGPSLFIAVVGAVVMLIGASWFGTRGQHVHDVTDYRALATEPGVFAVFAPIQQNFIGTDTFIKHQPPLAPYVRVQPSGGSHAAADLGLSPVRRHISLAAEHGSDATADDPSSISEQTDLADLRRGLGVRMHAGPMRDFTIVSHSLQRYGVSLSGSQVLGDVIERIASASGGVITASIDPKGERLLLHDSSRRAPIHLMGTDGAGSDVAARIIHATRVALSIGLVSTTIALLIGITAGALMGYFGGIVDIIGMRVIEIFMAIPSLFLLLTIIAFIPPQWNDYMLYAMMAVIGATSWMTVARYIRAEFYRLRDQDFVQAAKACGLPVRSVLFKHMLPNGVTPVLVDASFTVAAAILLETGLSFLGFGIKPPNPSWGQMLAEAVDTSTGVFYWWMAIFPGLMIFLTVFSLNLVGDALRDAIDPKLKKAAVA